MSKTTRAALAVCLLFGGAALAQQPAVVLMPPVAYPPQPMVADDTTDDGSPRLWGGAEYLLWWTSRPFVPALVTTGDPLDPTPGALGQPGTRILFGEGRIDLGTYSGVRATLGGWIDDEGRFGAEASFLMLESMDAGFSSASDAAGNPAVYFPLFRSDLGTQGSFTVSSPQAFPGLLSGNAEVRLTTRFWGAEGNAFLNVAREDNWQLDLFAGFRYLDLLENLYIAALGLFDPTFDIRQETRDQFKTRNQFYGGQGGFRLAGMLGDFTLALKAQLALGSTYQSVGITGLSTQSGPGVPNGVFAGGVFTQPSNISRIPRNAFTVVPQVGLSVGYELVDGVRVFGGWDYLYWARDVAPPVGRCVRRSDL